MRLCGLSGRSRGAPGIPRDAPESFPRSSRDPFGTLSGVPGCSESVPGTICGSEVNENRRKLASKTLLDHAARETLDSFASGRALESILAALACSWTLPGSISGVPGRLCGLSGRSRGAPGTPRVAPETFLRRSGDPFRALLGVPGRPESVPGTILDRFYMALPRPGWLNLAANDSPNDSHNEMISKKND